MSEAVVGRLIANRNIVLWYSCFARYVYHLNSVQVLEMLKKYQRTGEQ